MKQMKIGSRIFDTERHAYIMGILNVTPDSFSDGGSYVTHDAALFRAEQMIREGADVIDVGGESTRPGYQKISDEEEIARIAPVIEKIKAHFDIAVSADTYKSRVAAAALEAGADLINDIWGLKYDEKMAEVIKKYDAACCLMHNRETPQYENFIEDCLSDLKECIDIAKKAGIADDKIMVDPGVGFAKTYEQNLLVLRHLEQFLKLGYPLLLGTSRKSVIGLTHDVPTDKRLAGTLATTVLGVEKGAAFVRVHDVLENRHAIRMTEAVLYGY